MKIAMVDPSLFTLPYDEALCRSLQDLGHDVTLIGRPPRPDEPTPARDLHFAPVYYTGAAQAENMPEVVRLGIKAADHVASSVRLISHVGALKPDIIHFQWTPFPAVDRYVLPRLRKIAPLLLTVHDTRPFNDRPSSPLQRIGAQAVYRSFDNLIVHTRSGRDRLSAQGLTRRRISCIPHGPLGGTTLPDIQRYHSDPDAPVVVLLVGKLKPYKGADILIRAAALLPDALKAKTRFVIAGKPYIEVSTLMALAEQLGVRELFGFDMRFLPEDTLTQYLASASILAFPYREIEASGVLFAALRQGRPIVASALGSFAELLDDGVHGYLVKPEDPRALSHALARLIVDPQKREEMGHAVSILGEAIPSWDQIARATTDLYCRTALGQKRFAPPALSFDHAA